MGFDDVSLPAAVFICVTMVMALVGNSLVLLVYGFRWRSTNDTRVYIMTLAIMVLFCSLLVSPRNLLFLLPFSEGWRDRATLNSYCKFSIFFSYHFNFTSACILIFIAASRFAKVTKRDRSIADDSDIGICGGLKRFLKKVVHRFSTVRGAKIACVTGAIIALVDAIPALVIFGSGVATPDSLFVNVSQMIPVNSLSINISKTFPVNALSLNGSETSPHNESIVDVYYASCHDTVDPRYESARRTYSTAQFVVFVILTTFIFGFYTAILKRLCCSGEVSDLDSELYGSVYFSLDHFTVSSRLGARSKADNNSPENQPVGEATRTSNDSHLKENTEPGSPGPSSLIGLVVNECRNPGETPASVEQSEVKENQLEEESSLSLAPSTDVHRPDPVMSRQLSHQSAEFHRTRGSRCLSTTSFQMTKTGNRGRRTTLVFLLITSIYIVSYVPYFVAIFFENLVESGALPPWEEWSSASLAVLEICRTSYLISHAAIPLVYGLCNPCFREQLGKLLICRRDII